MAAAIVLIEHVLLLYPTLYSAYGKPPTVLPTGGGAWWSAFTPVHVLWDGSVSVLIFFVLSGYVLTLPLLRDGTHSWLGYYPQRFVRLYAPVWAAIVVSLVLIRLTHREPGVSQVLGNYNLHPGVRGAGIDAVLIYRPPGVVISTLWSLRWEVIFSALLPLYILFATRLRRWLLAKVVMLTVVIAVGAAVGPVDLAYRLGPLYQLPIFAFGALLACEGRLLHSWCSRLSAAGWAALGVVSVLLLSSYWLVYATGERSDLTHRLAIATRVLQVLGAVLVVVFAAEAPAVKRLLATVVAQWLGKRSFSLYLIHPAILLFLGYRLHAHRALAIVAVVAAALLAAEVFFRLAEDPSRKVARRVGLIAARVRA